MEDNIVSRKSFEDLIDTMKRADNDVNSRVRSNYKSMIKYYLQKGEGETSKYAGVIITQRLIDVFVKRFLELGGLYSEIYDDNGNIIQ